ncbi:MAG: ABC transporter substrate-binding protein [Lachnospirales bacterium]
MKKLIIATFISTLALVSCSTTESVETPVVATPTETAETPTEDIAEEPVEEVVEEVTTPTDVKVIMPTGTPALSFVQFITENPTIDENVNITYETLEATDVLTTTLINNEADIAIVPTNLAANLNSKGLDYKLVGSSVWGNFSLISPTEDITSLEDLKGKQITTFGQNLTPDAVLKYILSGNGIDYENDLVLEYLGGAPEVATSYISGTSSLALGAEPVLTNMLTKREGSKVVVNLQEEWEKLTGFESYPQASLIISNELIESNPEFVESFIQSYDESVDWINANPKDAGDYYEALNLGLTSAILEKAIPNASLDFVSVDTAKDSIDTYLNILYDFNPKLVGDVEINESLYYTK